MTQDKLGRRIPFSASKKRDASLPLIMTLGEACKCDGVAVAKTGYFRVIAFNSLSQRSSSFSYCSVVRPCSGRHFLKP